AQGQVVREGVLKLPLRVDVVIIKDGEAAESLCVASDKVPSHFVPVRFEAAAGGLHVTLHPFRWDCLRVHLPDGSAGMEWAPLLAGFEEWFRVDEDGTGDLLLAVHTISDPQEVEDGVTLTIDLGSAPVVAIDELLDALAGLDVSAVVLGDPAEDEPT